MYIICMEMFFFLHWLEIALVATWLGESWWTVGGGPLDQSGWDVIQLRVVFCWNREGYNCFISFQWCSFEYQDVRKTMSVIR